MASEDSTEDFVVVNEKDNAEREALTRLQTAADVLGKALAVQVASTEEIRAKYVRNLCSKLVSASTETAKLRAEVEALKLSADKNDKEMKASL
ncbi:unnamed protein product [Echinostoma caproni]|uniref:E3 ubiquitin protein ligase n=1 Tax=Echinostoma caproni TaxID=27848 RepID=A0A183B4Y4_9TREM|nr:unnamed protein product [Echinostoma caproni]